MVIIILIIQIIMIITISLSLCFTPHSLPHLTSSRTSASRIALSLCFTPHSLPPLTSLPLAPQPLHYLLSPCKVKRPLMSLMKPRKTNHYLISNVMKRRKESKINQPKLTTIHCQSIELSQYLRMWLRRGAGLLSLPLCSSRSKPMMMAYGAF